jgi:hypothetical protein
MIIVPVISILYCCFKKNPDLITVEEYFDLGATVYYAKITQTVIRLY